MQICIHIFLYILKNQTHNKLTRILLLLFTGDQNQLCPPGYKRYVGMFCLSLAIEVLLSVATQENFRQQWLKITGKNCYFHWSHLHLGIIIYLRYILITQCLKHRKSSKHICLVNGWMEGCTDWYINQW